MYGPQYYKTDYNFSGTTTTAPSITDIGSSLVPVGTMLLYAGTVLPINYLWCDGSQKSTTTYSTLYSVLGTTYNNSPASGNFNVPNMSKSLPIGASTPGNMTITYQGNNNTRIGGNSLMNSNQLASHTHNAPTNAGNYWGAPNDGGTQVAGGSTPLRVNFSATTGSITDVNATQEFLPPFTVVNYIIKYQ